MQLAILLVTNILPRPTFFNASHVQENDLDYRRAVFFLCGLLCNLHTDMVNIELGQLREKTKETREKTLSLVKTFF